MIDAGAASICRAFTMCFLFRRDLARCAFVLTVCVLQRCFISDLVFQHTLPINSTVALFALANFIPACGALDCIRSTTGGITIGPATLATRILATGGTFGILQ